MRVLRVGLTTAVALLASCTTIELSKESGVPIEAWGTTFISAGETTREEVLLKLGAPQLWSERDALMVYHWTWRVTDGWSSSHHYESGLLVVHFDENGRVRASGALEYFGAGGADLEIALGTWLREVQRPW